jgi:hypothetical protein
MGKAAFPWGLGPNTSFQQAEAQAQLGAAGSGQREMTKIPSVCLLWLRKGPRAWRLQGHIQHAGPLCQNTGC